MKKGFIGSVNWHSKTVRLSQRAFLFCIGEKCMSGKINKLKQLEISNRFEINIDFIEPDYFGDEVAVGKIFTVREASSVLGEGKVIEIL